MKVQNRKDIFKKEVEWWTVTNIYNKLRNKFRKNKVVNTELSLNNVLNVLYKTPEKELNFKFYWI